MSIIANQAEKTVIHGQYKNQHATVSCLNWTYFYINLLYPQNPLFSGKSFEFYLVAYQPL